MGKLTAARIKAITQAGTYQDGDGLMLRVAPGLSKSWKLRIQVNLRRRDIGLGSLKVVTLAEARQKALDIRRAFARGEDPIAEMRKRSARIPTFSNAARRLYAEYRPSWKEGKHQGQWLRTLELHAFPKLGNLRVNEIEGPIIRDTLALIWLSKPETARRVRQRIATVLDWCYIKGYRTTEAPTRALSRGLPRQRRRDTHFAAMPYQDVPSFIAQLHECPTVGRLALEFLILTATRSGEIRGAIWDEIDTDEALWSIPGDRMKTERPHQVPLSPEALDAIERADIFADSCYDYVFPGHNKKRPTSDMTLLKVLRSFDLPYTVHGFRSAFRDWVAEETDYPGEIAEAALAHTNPNKVEAAYRRTDFLNKRRSLMNEWGRYCYSLTDT